MGKIGQKLGQNNLSANLIQILLRSVPVYHERRFSDGNFLSYVTNGHFLGQICEKIGQKLDQISPSANLTQILLRSICVLRNTILH